MKKNYLAKISRINKQNFCNSSGPFHEASNDLSPTVMGV